MGNIEAITILGRNLPMEKEIYAGVWLWVGSWKQENILREKRLQVEQEKNWKEVIIVNRSRIEEKRDLLHLGVKGVDGSHFQDRMISSVKFSRNVKWNNNEDLILNLPLRNFLMLKSIFSRRAWGQGMVFCKRKKLNCMMSLMQKVLNAFARRFAGKEIDRLVTGRGGMVLEIR